MTRRTARLGVRGRLTMATAVGTFVALALTVAAGLWLLHRSLAAQLDEHLENRVEDTIEHLAEIGPSLAVETVPIPFGGDETFAAVWNEVGVVTRNEVPDDDHLDELADADGSVVSMAMPELTDLEGTDRMRVAVDSIDDVGIDWDDELGDPDADGPVYVAVGSSLDTVDRLTRRVGFAGGTLTLVFTALTATLVWVATGRSLAPVERLRAEAESITASDLTRRLPEPARADELGRLTTTLNGMLGRLARAHASQQQFVSDASHELRNPVAAVAANLEIGLRNAESTDWPATARSSLAEVQRVRRLIDDLLVLARSDEQGLAMARDLVDLDDVVLGQVAAIRPVSAVVIDTGSVSSAVVLGDPLRLGQVVGNLLANAVRHARTAVAVVVAERGGAAWICVDDDGPGVAAADTGRIFERFTRLEESRERDQGGSGLGLAICREIVAAHGGEIGVGTSRLGGARFWVRLPLSLA